ncbi:MAG: 4'-phosphopantetheinyl transferase family protein [Vicinamibacterales bacterium]
MADAERYTVARAALRLLLSRSLGRHPRDITFEIGPYGKLLLPQIQFNVAHSGDVVLLILHGQRAVGVDVERVNANADIGALMSRHFTPAEGHAVAASRDPYRTFFRIWARKEAWLKATGFGLSFPSARVDLSRAGHPDVAGSPPFERPRVGEFAVADLDVGGEYAAAWAIAEDHNPPSISGV